MQIYIPTYICQKQVNEYWELIFIQETIYKDTWVGAGTLREWSQGELAAASAPHNEE